MLIRTMRLLDQAALITTALGVIYFRPGLHIFSDRKLVAVPGTMGNSLAILVLALGWFAIFDYCVRYSAEDARNLGFEVEVIEAATRAIDLNGSAEATKKSFVKHGISLS